MHELVLALLFGISCSPLAFWWCCCRTRGLCNICKNDRAAFSYSILIPNDITGGIPPSGIYCDGCVNIVGTYIMGQFMNPFPTCSWVGSAPTPGACVGGVGSSPTMAIYTPAMPGWDGSTGTYRVIVKLETGGNQVIWQKSYGSEKPDCINFDEEEIPIARTGTATDPCYSNTGQSVFVTAV